MKTFIIIALTILCTWFISTQLSIEWPRIIIAPPPESPPSPGPKPEPESKPKPELESKIKSIEDAEFEVLFLINEERLKADCPTIIWNKYRHEKARAHSEYMAESGNFKHSSLSFYENIFKGIGFDLDEIPEVAVEEWMGSPAHKANLLNKEIKACGIGIAEADNHIIYVTYMAD